MYPLVQNSPNCCTKAVYHRRYIKPKLSFDWIATLSRDLASWFGPENNFLFYVYFTAASLMAPFQMWELQKHNYAASLKVNSRGQRPGSGVRSHKSPITVEVPAENLSVGGIVLTSKSCKRNYWLTATWQWHFLFLMHSQVLKAEENKAKTSNPIKTISLCVD